MCLVRDLTLPASFRWLYLAAAQVVFSVAQFDRRSPPPRLAADSIGQQPVVREDKQT